MKLFLALLVSAIASAQITPVVNVNSRYVVESIEVSGHDEFSFSRTAKGSARRFDFRECLTSGESTAEMIRTLPKTMAMMPVDSLVVR